MSDQQLTVRNTHCKHNNEVTFNCIVKFDFQAQQQQTHWDSAEGKSARIHSPDPKDLQNVTETSMSKNEL